MLRLLYFSIMAFFCLFLSLAEAATNKCTDGKQITYANVPCEEMGLKSAGAVKSLVTVIPAVSAEEQSKSGSAGEYKATKDETAEDKPAGSTTVKPVSPLVEKLLD